MESADIISALQNGFFTNSSFNNAVLPDAVGPNKTRTGIPCKISGFEPEIYFFGKDLARGKGNYLSVEILYFRVFEHGKLIRTPGSGGSDFVHILIVLD